MLNINFIKSYIRALKDYFFQKEFVKKSFALPMNEIKNKDFPNIFVTQPSKKINFDNEFVSRMRSIIHKEIAVSAHWEDMYQIGDKKNFHKDLLKMNDDKFLMKQLILVKIIYIMDLETFANMYLRILE